MTKSSFPLFVEGSLVGFSSSGNIVWHLDDPAAYGCRTNFVVMSFDCVLLKGG